MKKLFLSVLTAIALMFAVNIETQAQTQAIVLNLGYSWSYGALGAEYLLPFQVREEKSGGDDEWDKDAWFMSVGFGGGWMIIENLKIQIKQ
jgi:hypothetical protein